MFVTFHYRYFYKSESWGMSNNDFDQLLSKYLEHHGETCVIETHSGNLLKVHGGENAKEQFEILGTVSNFHWHGYPSSHDPEKIVGEKAV